jgi:hypothetical protein
MPVRHETTRHAIKRDLRRISEWAATLSIHFPHVQARFALDHARRRIHRLPENDHEEFRDFLIELEELIIVIEKFETGATSRIYWAEKVIALSCKI